MTSLYKCLIYLICMITSVFFDLGDTLIDRDLVYKNREDLNLRTFKEFGMEVSVDEFNSALKATLEEGKNYDGKLKPLGIFSFLLCKNLGKEVNMHTAAEIDKRFLEHSLKYTRLKEGTENILKYIKNKKYLLVLISNFDSYTGNRLVDDFDLRKYFDYILISEEFGAEKSTITPFKFIIKKFNLNPEKCIMIGDNETEDVIAAKGLGIKTARIVQKKDNVNSNADFIIERLDELREILK